MRLRRWAKGLCSLVVLLAALVGAPTVLAGAGWPLPSALPPTDVWWERLRIGDLPDAFWTKGAALAGWALWAMFVVCVFAEVVGRTMGPRRRGARFRLAGPFHSSAFSLVTSVALLLPSRPLPALGLSLDGGATVAAPAVAVAVALPHAPTEQPPGTIAYTVRRWDSLSRIARRVLGDADLWPLIWEINKYRDMGGRVFDDKHLIFKGWVLWIPDPARNSQAGPVDVGSPAKPPANEGPEGLWVADGASPATPAPPPPPSEPTPPALSAPPTVSSSSTAAAAPSEPNAHNRPLPADNADQPLTTLSPASAVGVGFALGVASTIAAGRVHRRRGYKPELPRPGRATRRADPVTLPSVVTAAATVPRTAAVEGGTDPAPMAPTIMAFDPFLAGSGSLAGEGAEAVLRAVVLSHVARPPHECRVLIDGALAYELLGREHPFEGLDIAATTAGLLAAAEVERARRVRLLDAADCDDHRSYAALPRDERVEMLLVVGRFGDERERARAAALVRAGDRLGVAVLTSGTDAAGVGGLLTVDRAGVVTDSVGIGVGPGALLERLSREDAEAIAVALAEARQAAEDRRADPHPEGDDFPLEPVTGVVEGAVAARGSVRVLGRLTLGAGRQVVRAGIRHKGRELLAYLSLHPEGERRERLWEDLLADVEVSKRQDQWSAAVSSVRGAVRQVLGRADVDAVPCENDVYRLDASVLELDLWRFQTALATAETADSPENELAALADALDAYAGDFVDGEAWDWVEPAREDLRRRALDVAVRLAELAERGGRPEEALRAVEKAIEVIDPYAEELYVRGVRLLVGLGRPEPARHLYAALRSRLRELDVDPMETTTDAIGSLLADAARIRGARDARERSPTGADP